MGWLLEVFKLTFELIFTDRFQFTATFFVTVFQANFVFISGFAFASVLARKMWFYVANFEQNVLYGRISCMNFYLIAKYKTETLSLSKLFFKF